MLSTINHHFYGKITVVDGDEGICQWLKKGSIWERPIVDLISEYAKPNTTVLDIGSHIGTHSIVILKSLKNTGKLISFEPQPFLYSVLKSNLDEQKTSTELITIHGAASNELGVCYVPIVDYNTCKNPGGIGIQLRGSEKYVEVPKLTVDTLNLDNVSFMKIDVEGHEISTIEGSRQTILKCKPVMIIEILGGVYRDKATPEQAKQISDTIDKITELGYTVTRIKNRETDYLCIPTKV